MISASISSSFPNLFPRTTRCMPPLNSSTLGDSWRSGATGKDSAAWCYLWYLFWVRMDYGTLFTLIKLGVKFLYWFYGLILIMDFSTLHVQECDQTVLSSLLPSSDFLQVLWCHDRFSYDLLVVFLDVLSCFLSDGLTYFCVLYLLFIVAILRHFSSFRHQGSCWWWYHRFMWLDNCLGYTWRVFTDHVCDDFAHDVGVDVD